MNSLDDTIVALSTPLGRAALAVVRLSGSDAVAIASRIFRGGSTGSGAGPLSEAPARVQRVGHAIDPTNPSGAMIDEVVAVVLRSPASYTGEDMVEITCHGGGQSAPRLVRALMASGARAAGPGEFTQRAFLNGRIDLAQAEAVADVIHAETELAHRLAARQIEGALSHGLSAIAEPLRDLLAETEARVDFAEDAGLDELPPTIEAGLAHAAHALDALLAGSDLGRRAREGVRLAIVGRPNVGKSSLFNALLGEDRAIVTAQPGTTRDAVSERWELAGVPVRLVDTAGVRDASGLVETLGIERARREIEGSDLVLWVLDRAEAVAEEDRAVGQLLEGRTRVVALNKSDRASSIDVRELGLVENEVVPVSARTGEGMAALRTRLVPAVTGESPGPAAAGAGVGTAAGGASEALVTNARHIDALERARTAIRSALAAAQPLVPETVGAPHDPGADRASSADPIPAGTSAPGEIVAGEIRVALAALGEVTGEAVAPDLLDRIFARFCIGK
ncbi:MAG: tRNA uridine-5-carboxymethylaminomethyl(34) synthesis GTPase MnmE [Candidatus Eiseniibacteriota bacterium]